MNTKATAINMITSIQTSLFVQHYFLSLLSLL